MSDAAIEVETGPGSAVRVALDGAGAVADIAPVARGGALADEIATFGMVDLQVNGFAGIDFNDPAIARDGLDRALTAMAATGCLVCLPTLISAAVDRLEACFRALERAANASPLARLMVPGYHLEGPFLSPVEGYRGCHPPDAMIPADIAVFDRLNRAAGGRIRLLTLAAEVDGAMALIRHARAHGVAVALGHTGASAAQVREAADAGARLSTHLGNGAPALLPRKDNVILAQLAEDRMMASFIADGLHVPPATLRVYARAKGHGRTVLVTDATAAACAGPGDYTLGPVPIRRDDDGPPRLPGTAQLAGSSLTLDRALNNMASFLGIGFAEALGMARDLPLRLMGMPALPAPGEPAGLVHWRRANGAYLVSGWRLGSFAGGASARRN
ncbi:MAG: N-acetylglucosamine-6-phosphate deacetylase [Rhodospirillales bacterium]